MKKLIFVIGLFLVISIFSFLIFKEGTLPVNTKDKTTKIFVIRPGESVSEIGKHLENENLIRSKVVFYLVVKQLRIDDKIQAGDFRLSSSMNTYEIAQNLTKGTLDVWVTLIEGLRKEEIAEILAKNLPISQEEFIKTASEGALFPDTYLIPREASVETIISILNRNFNNKFNDELRLKTRRLGLKDEQALTMASIVERESSGNVADRQKVASILLRRYNNGYPLQADATVQYALGYQIEEKRWWKKQTTFKDLEIDSPYNTYKNAGLPPGPISNPGLDSIIAVAEADPNTPYFYYVSDKTGIMRYAKTLEEHNTNVQKYLR